MRAEELMIEEEPFQKPVPGIILRCSGQLLGPPDDGKLIARINQLCEDRTNTILIMRDIWDFDAQAVGTIVIIFTKMHNAGVNLFFCELNSAARRTFDESNMIKHCEVFSTIEAALEALAQV